MIGTEIENLTVVVPIAKTDVASRETVKKEHVRETATEADAVLTAVIAKTEIRSTRNGKNTEVMIKVSLLSGSCVNQGCRRLYLHFANDSENQI